MSSRPLMVIVSAVLAVVLLTGACSAGFIAGRVLPDATPSLANAPIISDIPALPDVDSTVERSEEESEPAAPEDVEQTFAPFWQAWDIIHEQYVDQPVDNDALMRGAIKGMIEALGDEHSSYMDPDSLDRINSQLYGEEYEGIGAWVDTTSEFLTIINPMPGSPAEEAGLKPGDEIIGVDGEDVSGLNAEEVRLKVVGPQGTEVTLTIRRQGVEEPFDVVVERASITVPSLESRVLEDNIAYVRLYTFADRTDEDLRAALTELMRSNPDGLVLDLRGNVGGLLQTGINVVSEFIGDGVVMYEQYGDGDRITFDARPGGVATEIPLVVLIDAGSASASEIVAGAIQDRERGQLVGVTSFGKGSVQTFTPLGQDGGAVRITVARWLTPDGKTIHEVGLTPDVVVELTEEDIANDRDPQLDKAVELLLAE